MKIKILAEGSTKWQRFIKHWGLSILVDDDILFDTFGQPGHVLEEMKRLHLDPLGVKHIIISHDDWDHIAGLPGILEQNKKAVVYICPHFKPGIKAMIKSYGVNMVEADKPVEVRKNIYISGELKGGSRNGVDIPEQYLAIKAQQGIIVITGCAHPGIIDIVRHARRNFGPELYMLIGGFHLKDNPLEVNKVIVKELRELGVHKVMPLHCTGQAAGKIFAKEYQEDCVIISKDRVISV